MSRIIDISQTIKPGIPVWPGDTEYNPFWVMRMDRGDSCNVGSITMSLHTGTHADAPFHFQTKGSSPADVDLHPYVGPALVIDLTGIEVIEARHLVPLKSEKIERLLIKTLSADADLFTRGFSHLSADAAQAAVDSGLELIGLDTPSVDQADSKSLDAHKILAAGSVAILENLVLSHVSPGWYELIALPLKLSGMDASPVRAILRTP